MIESLLQNMARWEWYLDRPEDIQAVMRQLPPMACLRGIEGKGHYRIYSYDESEDGPVTLQIVHGRDSFLPGYAVFGVNPATLSICDCGGWYPAR